MKKKKKGRKRKNERGEAFENESIREKREEDVVLYRMKTNIQIRD